MGNICAHAVWLLLVCTAVPACSQLGYLTTAPKADVAIPLPSTSLSPTPVQAQLTASRAVIILLDDSLSMEIPGYDPDGYRYELAEHILSKLMPRDSVAVAIFGGHSAAIPDIEALHEMVQKGNRQEYERLLASLSSKPHLSERSVRNKTNFKAALAPALELLSQPRFQSSDRHIFLLTDGEMDVAGDNDYDKEGPDDSTAELDCLQKAGKLASGQPNPQHHGHEIAIHAFGFSPGLTDTARAFLEKVDHENRSRFSAGVRELKVQVDIALARLVDVVPVEPTGKREGEFRFAVDPTVTELVLQVERLEAGQPIQLEKTGNQSQAGTIENPPGDEWTWTFNSNDLTETISYRATQPMPDEYQGTWLLHGCRQVRCQGIINQESNSGISHGPEFTIHPLLGMYALPESYLSQDGKSASPPLELSFLKPVASGRGITFAVRLAELRGDAFQPPDMNSLSSLFQAGSAVSVDVQLKREAQPSTEEVLRLVQSQSAITQHIFHTLNPWHGEPGVYSLSTRVNYGNFERASASTKLVILPYELLVGQPQAPLSLNASTHLTQADFARQGWLMRQLDMGLSTLLIYKPNPEPEFMLSAEVIEPDATAQQLLSGFQEIDKIHVYQRIGDQLKHIEEITAGKDRDKNGREITRFEALIHAERRPPGSSGQLILIPEPYAVDAQVIPVRFTGITTARGVVVLAFLLVFSLLVWIVVRALIELFRPRFHSLRVNLNDRQSSIGYLAYILDITAPGGKRSLRGIGYRRMTCFSFSGDQFVKIIKRRTGYLVAVNGLELHTSLKTKPARPAKRGILRRYTKAYIFDNDQIEFSTAGLALKIHERGRGLVFN